MFYLNIVKLARAITIRYEIILVARAITVNSGYRCKS